MNAALRTLIWVFVFVTSACHASAQDTDDAEGGIIGTGIVGTITNLGSIYVNGQHIQLDGALPVEDSNPPILGADLRPGHTVAVTVQAEGAHWRALNVRQVLPLVGPVRINGDDTLSIMGTDLIVDAKRPNFSDGDWLAVSGLWQGTNVLASRIDVLPPENLLEARITGTYFGDDGSNQFLVGDSILDGIEPRHLKPGDVLQISGVPYETGISAKRIETGWFTAQTGLIQVEGFYSEPQPSGLYTILGSGLVAYTNNPEMIGTQKRIIQCGQDGKLQDDRNFTSENAIVARRLGCIDPE